MDKKCRTYWDQCFSHLFYLVMLENGQNSAERGHFTLPLEPPSYGLFTRGMRLENDIFWQISNLTTLMTLNWSGNIGKHLATPKYPHLDLKSNKIGLSGGILALWVQIKSMSTTGVNCIFAMFCLFYDAVAATVFQPDYTSRYQMKDLNISFPLVP